jgi:glutamate N-acetyltransferase/amino-acid N-acetyltransferase
MSKTQNVKAPRGFQFSTEEATIKKPGRKDMALIFSDVEGNIAGTFTTNSVKAAPVKICARKIKTGRGQAIVVSSGNANACTGLQGLKDAESIVSHVSGSLGIKSSLTYICSTGIIGVPLPIDKIIPSVYKLTKNIGKSSLRDVAEAIMTTDMRPKVTQREITIGKKVGRLSAVCKGAGMIAPDMATMLCFILTDIAIERKTLTHMLKNSVKKSFNRITVDGDTSTNDTVLMISNGMIGNNPITRKSRYYKFLQKTLDDLTRELSKLVVRDGEGSTKFIELLVKGARNERDAERAAFSVANSNLVKTAIFGNDPNWGRMMAAVGYSGIKFKEDKTDIYFEDVKVVKGGISNGQNREAAKALAKKEIKITIDLHAGNASANVLTCDLSEEYVRINAEYRT